MIRLGLWGISKRATAWRFVWLSIVLAAGCIVIGFWNHVFFAGAIWILSALWYLYAIRWVDDNGKWNVNRRKESGDDS